MRKYLIVLMSVIIICGLIGCESDTNIPRDEIPLIKESITALEKVIKLENVAYFDSLSSSEISADRDNLEKLKAFVFSDGITEFSGFTGKQIVYRDNAARIDCQIMGGDSASKPVTLTFKKEQGNWLFKNIEVGSEKPIPIMPDTTAVEDDD